MFLVEVVRAALLLPIILFNSIVPHMQVYAVRADQCCKKDQTTVLCFRGMESNACREKINHKSVDGTNKGLPTIQKVPLVLLCVNVGQYNQTAPSQK